MASMLEMISSIVTREGDSSRRFGRVDEPYFMSIDGDLMEKKLTVAAATTKAVFVGAADEFATISFLALRSDMDAAVELTFDTANTYGTTRQTYTLEGTGVAGEYGPPLVLALCQAYANYTANFAAGTLCYCDYVRVRNLSAASVCKFEILYGE